MGPRIPRWGLAGIGLILIVAACSLIPNVDASWKVDVVNGDRPLLITITTDRSAAAWLVPAHAEMVLLDQQSIPSQGRIELIDPAANCITYDSADRPRTSFTITPVQVAAAPLDYGLNLVAGASLIGPVNTDFFGGCSG